MSPAWVTGMVLAGGRSSRFGEDKLVAEIDGRPLLHLAIDAVAGVVDEIVVVVGADALAPVLPPHVPVPVVVARDAVAGQGPLAGLAAGLAAASHPLALLVGGDQPALRPALLRELLRRLDEGPVARRPTSSASMRTGSFAPCRSRSGSPACVRRRTSPWPRGRAAWWACSAGSGSRRWRRSSGARSTPRAFRCGTSTRATTCRRPEWRLSSPACPSGAERGAANGCRPAARSCPAARLGPRPPRPNVPVGPGRSALPAGLTHR